MPSESKKQHNFMEAADHDPEFASKHHIPQSVAREYVDADKGRHYAKGGLVAGVHSREGVRDPSSHRTPEQIHAMDAGYNHSPEMIKRRANDNNARKMLGLRKGDPRDAGHKKSQDRGGKTTKSNLEPESQNYNRGWRRRGVEP